jgi:transcriptional regulator with XRE-family HTH domain
MKKEKLIEKRKQKGLSQSEIADQLFMDTSSYSRRENGQVKITSSQWTKLAEILDVSVEKIYESKESQAFIGKNNATVQYQDTNNIYSTPEYLLEIQRKYIEKLENENRELRQENRKLRLKKPPKQGELSFD